MKASEDIEMEQDITPLLVVCKVINLRMCLGISYDSDYIYESYHFGAQLFSVWILIVSVVY